MPRARFRTFIKGLVLTPPADETPPDGLRRARNIGPLLDGRLTAAPPFKLLEDVGISSAIHSIVRFSGKLFAALGTTLRRNAPGWATLTLPGAYTTHAAITLSGAPLTFVQAPSTSEENENLFVVDQAGVGDNLFKVNAAGTATRWGIHPLTQANLTDTNLVRVAQSEIFIHTTPTTDPLEAAGDWTLAQADEDALSGDAAIATEATIAVSGTALKFTVGRDDSAQITRTFGSNIDLTEFTAAANDSTDEDFIQVWVRVRRPSRIENFEIAFDTTTAATKFTTSYFSREVTFKQVNRRRRAQLIALGDLVEVGKEQEFLAANQGRADDQTFNAEVGNQQISVAKNTWTRLTLPKSSFQQVGTPDWSTVRAIRFTLSANKDGKTAVFLDRLTMNGGTGMLGRYQYTYTIRNSSTGTRSNPFIDAEGNIVNRTPLGTGGLPVDIERQSVSIAVALGFTFDPQADQFEIWRTMGNGQVYFKVGHITLTTPGSLPSTGSPHLLDRTADYAGLQPGQSGTYTQVLAGVGTFTGNAYLDPSETLPLDNDTPNNSDFLFKDAVGPHVGRMWWFNNAATAGGAGNGYYSPSGRLEAVSAFIQITSGESDPVVKGVIWNDRLYAFSTGNMYEIVGTNEPFIARRIEGAPGTLLPNTVVAASLGIFWVAADGVYYFDGTSATNITDATLAPIFRLHDAIEDFTSPSYPSIAAAGRNGVWFGNGIVAPVALTLVFDFDTRAWRYREKVTALYYDSFTGRMLGAPVGGGAFDDIYNLEPFPFDNTGVTQTLDVKTSEVRAGPGVKGILRKVYIEIDSVSEAAITVEAFIDGTAVTLGTLSVVTGRRVVEFNVNRAGERFAIRVSGTSINEAVVIYGIEMDLYVPSSASADLTGV